MYEVDKTEMKKIAPLFEGIQDSMVIACLQGYMGKAYTRSSDSMEAALIVSGEYSFFAGDPESEDAGHLIRNLFLVNPSSYTVAIFNDEDPRWEKRLMSVSENHPVIVPRHGIVQKDYHFDQTLLTKYIKRLPEDVELISFDGNLYRQAMGEEWSKEFCEIFASEEEYLERGFGFGVVMDGKLVSGASTMTAYDGGIEVQVATDEHYQGRGYAMACAAALILECAKRGIRPCWDAANEASLHMALRLGYEYQGIYTTIQMSREE